MKLFLRPCARLNLGRELDEEAADVLDFFTLLVTAVSIEFGRCNPLRFLREVLVALLGGVI